MTKWHRRLLFSLFSPSLMMLGISGCILPPPKCINFYLRDKLGNDWVSEFLNKDRLVQTYHKACNYLQNSEENPDKNYPNSDCQYWTPPYPKFPVYKRVGNGCSGSGDNFTCDYSRYYLLPPNKTNYDIPISYNAEVHPEICNGPGPYFIHKIELQVQSVHVSYWSGEILNEGGWYVEARKIFNHGLGGTTLSDNGTLWFNPWYRLSRWHNNAYFTQYSSLSTELDSDLTWYPDPDNNENFYIYGDQPVPNGEEPYNAVGQPIQIRLIGFLSDGETDEQVYLKVMSPIHWWDDGWTDGSYIDLDTGGRRDAQNQDSAYGHYSARRVGSTVYDHEAWDIAIDDPDKDGLYGESDAPRRLGCGNNNGYYIPAVALVSCAIVKGDYDELGSAGCYVWFDHEGGLFNDYRQGNSLGTLTDEWTREPLTSVYYHLAIFPSGGTTVSQNNGDKRRACINGLRALFDLPPINPPAPPFLPRITRSAGQIVGVVGRTGYESYTNYKTHLHFAIHSRSRAYAYDPETFIQAHLLYPFCNRTTGIGSYPCAKCPKIYRTGTDTCLINGSTLRCDQAGY